MFDGMAEAIKVTPVPKGGISRDNVTFHAHQYRITQRLSCLIPCDAVIGIDRLVVPDGRRVQHRMVIDLCDGGAVLFAGESNRHVEPQGLYTIVLRYEYY